MISLQRIKTVFSKNAILIILANTLIGYGTNMENTYRTLFAANEVGLSSTMLGTAVTFFLLVSALFGPVSGLAADRFRRYVKPVMTVILIVRFFVFIGFNWIETAFGYFTICFLDGVCFAFINSVIPALLAINVDRRAMGTSYAVSICVLNIVSSPSVQLGVSLYNTYGVLPASAVAGGLGLAAAVLLWFMDSKKMAVEREAHKDKSVKFGICFSMLPLCLVTGAMAFYSQFYRSFMVIIADGLSINCLPYMTAGQAVSGVLAVLIGFACDLVDPFILILFSLIALIPLPLGWAVGASNPSLFCLSTACMLPLMYNQTAMRILGMKVVDNSQQGAFQATFGMTLQLTAMLASQMIGLALDSIGFKNTMYALCGWSILTLAAFVFIYKRNLRQI